MPPVHFWNGNDGHETPEEFLARLANGDEAQRAAFARCCAHIELLAERGRGLTTPAVTLCSAPALLYALGTQHGAGQPRLLFSWVGGEALVLHAFLQCGPKIDVQDLQLALTRLYGESPTWGCLFLAPGAW